MGKSSKITNKALANFTFILIIINNQAASFDYKLLRLVTSKIVYEGELSIQQFTLHR